MFVVWLVSAGVIFGVHKVTVSGIDERQQKVERDGTDLAKALKIRSDQHDKDIGKLQVQAEVNDKTNAETKALIAVISTKLDLLVDGVRTLNDRIEKDRTAGR